MTDTCPTCGGPPVRRCRCMLGDMECAAGHAWHHCPKCRRVIPGHGDHSAAVSANACEACRPKPLRQIAAENGMNLSSIREDLTTYEIETGAGYLADFYGPKSSPPPKPARPRTVVIQDGRDKPLTESRR